MKMKTSPSDVSNNEILSVLQSMQGDVKDLKRGQEDLAESMQGLANLTDERFDRLENRMDKNEFRLNRVESLMVTKDYLDDKLADLRSDISNNTAKQIEKALN